MKIAWGALKRTLYHVAKSKLLKEDGETVKDTALFLSILKGVSRRAEAV